MKAGFIGAGKVGFSLGKYFSEHGIQVTGYYSRHAESAKQAAEFTNSKCYEDMKLLVSCSDVIFLTVPDGAIKSTYELLKTYDITNKQICHCSGALSAKEVFADVKEKGAIGYSIHPLFPVSDKLTSYKEMPGAFFCLEGDGEQLDRKIILTKTDFDNSIVKEQISCKTDSNLNGSMKLMEQSEIRFGKDMNSDDKARELSIKSFWTDFFQRNAAGVKVIDGASKAKYHAACAIASNLYCALMQESLELLSECGFQEQEALKALTPLVESNLKHILQDGPVKALTGPVERGDADTVQKHMCHITEEANRRQYMAVSSKLLEVAKKKNPDRDYSEVEYILREASRCENI